MMKHEVWALMKIDLRRGLFAFRRLKPGMRVLLAVGILLGGASVLGALLLYDWALYGGFAALGRPELMLTLMMVLASLITLVFTLWRGPQALFQGRDLPGLLALPLRARSIADARLLRLYLSDLGFSALVVLPAVGMEMALSGFDGGLLARVLPGLLALPAVPLVLGCVVGTAVLYAASRFRHSSVVSLLLSVALLVGVMILSATSPMEIDYAALGEVMERQICALYPPAGLWQRGVMLGEPGAFALFLALGAAALAAFSAVFGRWMKPLYHRLSSRRAARKGYRTEELKVRGAFSTLYRKELLRLFTSSTYLLNAGTGALLLAVAAVAVLFVPRETVVSVLAQQGIPSVVLGIMLPYALSFFAMLTLPGAVSVSLEGRQLWLVKSLPIRIRQLLLSKALVNLTLALPPAALAAAALWWKLALPLADGLRAVLLPLLFGGFISFAGVVCNLLLPRFDWQSEAQVIKRGGSLLLCMVLGFAALILSGLLQALVTGTAGAWAPCVLLAVLTAVSAAVLVAWGPKRFRRL